MKGDDVRLGFLAANIGKISSNKETIKGFFQRIKRQKEMRRQTFFKAMLALSIFFASFTAKAQLDTAWFQDTHSSQYIYPPLADSNYRYEGDVANSFFNMTLPSSNVLLVNNGDQGLGNIRRFAQRYEVRDSLKIMGVSLFVVASPSLGHMDCDTVTVGIWDETLSNELYSKTFVSGGITPYANGLKFVEYLFDDTITLYGDYHVSISYDDPCPFYYLGIETAFTFLFLREYLTVGFGGTNDETYCPPAGCGTKYPLYVSFCNGERMSEWIRAIDVNNWRNESTSYQYYATYIRSPLANCDTMVYAPAAICPIRALEDTVSQDTTSNSVLSVELLEKAVRLYPNPANEVLNVACDYDISTVAVFDAVNRLVEERKVNSKTLQLPLANYAQGTYFITITTPKGKLNKKFVVQ